MPLHLSCHRIECVGVDRSLEMEELAVRMLVEARRIVAGCNLAVAGRFWSVRREFRRLGIAYYCGCPCGGP